VECVFSVFGIDRLLFVYAMGVVSAVALGVFDPFRHCEHNTPASACGSHVLFWRRVSKARVDVDLAAYALKNAFLQKRDADGMRNLNATLISYCTRERKEWNDVVSMTQISHLTLILVQGVEPEEFIVHEVSTPAHAHHLKLLGAAATGNMPAPLRGANDLGVPRRLWAKRQWLMRTFSPFPLTWGQGVRLN